MLWRNKNALIITTIKGLGAETLKLPQYGGRPEHLFNRAKKPKIMVQGEVRKFKI